MAYEHKERAGSFFANDGWTSHKQPIFKGKTKINGKIEEIAVWLPDDFPTDRLHLLPKRLSFKISEPRAVAPVAQAPVPAKQPALAQELDDDIPF